MRSSGRPEPCVHNEAHHAWGDAYQIRRLLQLHHTRRGRHVVRVGEKPPPSVLAHMTGQPRRPRPTESIRCMFEPDAAYPTCIVPYHCGADPAAGTGLAQS
jgi:hypothetical protein